MILFTCPRCYRTIAIPEHYAGLVCPCSATPIPQTAPAPSPAGTQGQSAPPVRSEGQRDGGRGASDSAPVPTGRGPEKGPQRSPQGQGGPIEASAKPKALEGDWKPDRDLQERADAWFSTKFFKKGGVGDDEWKPLVAACKTWGMPKDAKWRQWLGDEWKADRANAIKVLITAGAIVGPKASPDQLTADQKKVYDYLKTHPNSTLSELQANVDPKVSDAMIDALVNLELVYSPVVDKWAVV